jgi:hypothetical protein
MRTITCLHKALGWGARSVCGVAADAEGEGNEAESDSVAEGGGEAKSSLVPSNGG